jgi:transmembrane sensor
MNAQIHQAACEWFVEFRAGEPDERARRSFHAWLRESPAHMAAYLEVAASWAESGAGDVGKRWSVEELVLQARAEPDNVMVLSSSAAMPESGAINTEVGRRAQSASGRPAYLFRPRAVVAAASIVLVLGLALAGWFSRQPEVYATTVGEQRVVTLADGSVIRLNARSKLKVKFEKQRRAVELLEGQALFQVAKDVHRPFTVASDGTRVQAVGTEFDVRRNHASLVVTVVEGRVAVFDIPAAVKRSASNAGPVYVSAGEQVTVSPAGPGSAKPIDPAIATAWTHRQLVFEATPLSEVAEEFNRYNVRRLVIRDPALQTFEVDGVFSSPDPAPLIRFLRSKPGVRVIETDSEIIVDSATPDRHGETH